MSLQFSIWSNHLKTDKPLHKKKVKASVVCPVQAMNIIYKILFANDFGLTTSATTSEPKLCREALNFPFFMLYVFFFLGQLCPYSVIFLNENWLKGLYKNRSWDFRVKIHKLSWIHACNTSWSVRTIQELTLSQACLNTISVIII